MVAGMDTSRFPVETVSWENAVEFCRRLSALPDEKRHGRQYRLPTEAEWEYACRAGSQTTFCFGDEDAGLERYAWRDRNSGGRTHPVGRKKPNAWGLYDMHGNVSEWCQDAYALYGISPGSDAQQRASVRERVFRGGSWLMSGRACRSANRFCGTPWISGGDLGFRVALAVEDG